MQFRIAEARKELQAFDLKKLFIEQMGWDNPGADITIRFNGQSLRLKAIAQKRGFGAFTVPPIDGKIPDYATRRKIETEVRKIIQEHVLIFTDAEGNKVRWQWVRREPGKPTTAREYEFTKGQSGDALLQRLEKMYFALEDEENIGGIVDAASRVRSAFDVERVTRRFYDRFKDEHTAFTKFIKGIPDKEMQSWYVSVTLNRLMFVYFIQSKGFLNDDRSYLKNHLAESKKKGKDLFYSDFLCPLFFEGFAKKRHSAETKKLLGNIPYLNGGIFEKHQIEELHGEKIEIPDKAFEKLFEFFDGYRWHLDERPNKADNEINPDVLGYIFEKYINQKQMGAYYTKEDITEYNSKNTIIPYLFDVAQRLCNIAFEGEGSVWRHLQADPDRYIYAALRYGVDKALPAEIAQGEFDPKRREGWNKPASDGFALPTEIWREVVARRRRYQEVKEKLANGEVTSINDLITLNLDIRQFAQDVIEDSDADLLAAFWKALTQIKILDPTVGSGAFLFAALNILEPLYEACLERMSALVEELDRSGEKHSPKKYEPFRKALDQVRQRPDEDYFIFKSIIINNLYGVDIMEEAVEICKLRLFLKLASQVEPDASKENLGIEPLPDIDFNIRAGNTLVGFATREDVERSVNMGITGGKQKVQSEKLFSFDDEKDQLKLIEEKAEDVDRLYKLFRQQQTEYGGEVNADDKKKLEKKLEVLEDELNVLLAKQYGIHNPKGEDYQKWLESHTPFHWFVEFFGIMNEGGFDVIIGNPPYVEYRLVEKDYKLQPNYYRSQHTDNLYAYCMERSTVLIRRLGRFGMIVPVGVLGLDNSISIRRELLSNFPLSHCSTFSVRPSKLFEGVDQRLCIYLGKKDGEKTAIFTTQYNRWNADERSNLFAKLRYQESISHKRLSRVPQLGNNNAYGILLKLENQNHKLVKNFYSTSSVGYLMHYHRSPNYWIRAMDFEPYFKSPTKSRSNYHFRDLYFADKYSGKVLGAILNSTLFFYWFIAIGNGRNVTGTDVEEFPVGDIKDDAMQELPAIFDRLMKDYNDKSHIRVRKDTELQEFQPGLSKPIIDEIDRALARHYGLSDEELDFIINYDVKYRMGAELEGENDEA